MLANMKELFYNPLHTDWFYSFLAIPNLENITTELINLKNSNVKQWRKNSYYVNILEEDARPLCPHVMQYLSNAGVAHKFERFLYSGNATTSDSVHIDSYDPAYCQTSLNIPLYDCEESYTAWYSTKHKKLNDFSSTGINLNIGQQFAWLPITEVEEIARVEVTRPMLVNTTILHRGIIPNANRTLCGIRFTSPLTHEEIKNLGIDKPFVQL
jgi:hypothetical protein